MWWWTKGKADETEHSCEGSVSVTAAQSSERATIHGHLSITTPSCSYLSLTTAAYGYLSRARAGYVYLLLTTAAHDSLPLTRAAHGYLLVTKEAYGYLSLTTAAYNLDGEKQWLGQAASQITR